MKNFAKMFTLILALGLTFVFTFSAVQAQGKGKGFKMGMMGFNTNLSAEELEKLKQTKEEMKQLKEKIQQAIENKDYQEWKALIESKNPQAKILEKINADNFGKFVELHNLKKNKNFVEARKLMEELGLNGMQMGMVDKNFIQSHRVMNKWMMKNPNQQALMKGNMVKFMNKMHKGLGLKNQ